MKAQIASSDKDATSTVSQVVEIDRKEERALVWSSILRHKQFTSLIFPLGLALRYLFLDHWVLGLRVQVPRSDQHCTVANSHRNDLLWPSIRVMHMFLGWKQTSNSMEMSSIILRLSSSTFSLVPSRGILINRDSIGYMIMLYPSCIIVSHVGPSIWLPTCEVKRTTRVLVFITGANRLSRLSGESWHAVYRRSPMKSR